MRANGTDAFPDWQRKTHIEDVKQTAFEDHMRILRDTVKFLNATGHSSSCSVRPKRKTTYIALPCTVVNPTAVKNMS